ncbi:ankyrin repeat domain-containing protein [Bdellovibrio sp. HCB337]|uniref:ankyrin repeat domain-containing protein n=1 Tax=Bdellovibrio sp. HCB337 TaxID=3394358 RepID=UPI0039A5A47C
MKLFIALFLFSSMAFAQMAEGPLAPPDLLPEYRLGEIADGNLFYSLDESCCLSGRTNLTTTLHWQSQKGGKIESEELGSEINGKIRNTQIFLYKDYVVVKSWLVESRFEHFEFFSWSWTAIDPITHKLGKGSYCTLSDPDFEIEKKKWTSKTLSETNFFEASDRLATTVYEDMTAGGYYGDLENRVAWYDKPKDELEFVSSIRDIANKERDGLKVCTYLQEYPLSRWINEDLEINEDHVAYNEEQKNAATDASTGSQLLGDMGFFLQKAQFNADAVKVLNRVLKMSPDRAVSHLNIADAYWDLGKANQAKAHYRQYVELVKKTRFTDIEIYRAQKRIASKEKIKALTTSKTCPVFSQKKKFADAVRSFLKEGGSPNASIPVLAPMADTPSEVSLIQQAVKNKNTALVIELLNKGALMFRSDGSSNSLFSSVVSSGNLEMVKALIERGAMKGDAGKWNRKQALSWSFPNNLAIVKLLIENGAEFPQYNLENMDHSDWSKDIWKYVYTSHEGYPEPKVDQPDSGGFTALHVAVMSKNKNWIEFVLEKGADVNALTGSRETALDLLKDRIESDNPEVKSLMTYLKSKGALTAKELVAKAPQEFYRRTKANEVVPDVIQNAMKNGVPKSGQCE